MIRYSQRGAVDLSEAKKIITSLAEKRYPLIEEVEGRIYIHIPKESATDVILIALAYRYPDRITRAELIDIVKRNGFSLPNANVAVLRALNLIDSSDEGLRILAPALARAERLLQAEEERLYQS